MTGELHAEATRLLARAEVAAVQRVIMTGDPRELEILGRYLGVQYGMPKDDEGVPSADKPYVFNVLVPRPEWPALPGAPTPAHPDPELPVQAEAVGPRREVPFIDVRRKG
jgi:hypothetical protein